MAVNPPVQTTPTAIKDQRWGVVGTLAGATLVMAAFALIQAVFLGAYLAATGGVPDLQQEMNRLLVDGDIIAVSTLLTTTLCVPLIIGMIKLKRGSQLARYLPVAVPPRRELIRWLLFTAIFVAASDTLSMITGNPVVPDFAKQTYLSADSKLLLWVALVLAGPVFEETLFRGFMISGLVRSWFGMSGAAALTALAWAAIHLQYDWCGIATIFAFGLLLAAARIKTDSLVTPLLLHAAANLFATLETVVSLSGA